MKDVLLHENDREKLESFIKQPSHAIGLIAPRGFGKGFIAHQLASNLTGHQTDITAVREEDGSITIDQIRQIRASLRLKNNDNRVVIIEDAELMTVEAQNALLKILEEPGGGVIFILTVNALRGLRPTVVSRLKLLHLQPPGREEVEKHFKDQEFDPDEVKKAYDMTAGHVGLMHHILTDKDHPIADYIATAKEILAKSTYERLALVDSLHRDKDRILGIIYALKRILKLAGERADGKKQLARITSTRRAVHRAESALAVNANAKLVLTDLFLNI